MANAERVNTDKKGLRLGLKELENLQSLMLTNMRRLISLAVNTPSVLTTKTSAGVLGTDLKVNEVDASNANVSAGVGVTTGFDIIRQVGTSASIPVATDSTTRALVVTYTPVTVEQGTVSVVTGSAVLTLDPVAGEPDFLDLYDIDQYIRLSQSSNGSNGVFRILSVDSAIQITLTDNVPGTTEGDLSFSQAGKFFVGYPITGVNRDEFSHDGVTYSEETIPFTPNSDQLQLATVHSTGSVLTIVDVRDAATLQLQGIQITDANVDDAAAIAESKISLAASTVDAKTNQHVQNTDTHTTQSTFHVGGVPASNPRVLTEDDLERLDGPIIPDEPASMAVPINFSVIFTPPLIIFNLSPSYSRRTTSDIAPPPTATIINWGIEGVGTYDSGSDTFTITAGHDGPILAVDDLVDYIFIDSANEHYKITANTAAAAAGDSFTVTIAPFGGQAEPSNGSFTIRTNARSYFVTVTPYNSDGTTLNRNNDQVYWITPDGNNVMRTGLFPNYSIQQGVKVRVELNAVNRGVTSGPSVQTVGTDVFWGTVNDAGAVTVNVISSTISVSPRVGAVLFTWSNPAEFVASSMFYQVAATIDGSTPEFLDDVIPMQRDSVGAIGIPAEPGQTVKISVRVLDFAGDLLSTATGDANGRALGQAFADNTIDTGPISFDFDNAAFDDTTTLPGTTLAHVIARNFLRGLVVVGIEMVVNILSGTTPAIKGVVYRTSQSSINAFSQEITSVGGSIDNVLQDGVGTLVSIAIEKTSASGAITQAKGYIIIHYQELGALDRLERLV